MLARIDARIIVLIGAVLFSTGGAAIKGTTLTGWQVAAFRSGVGFLALLVMLPSVRRQISWRVLLVSVAYAATLTLFVLANKLTTAANTIFLQSAAPLYVLLLAPLLLREHMQKRDLWFMAALATGLALFFVSVEAPTETAPAPLLGNTLAGVAGLTWAMTLIGLRWLAVRSGTASAAASAATGNLLTFLFCASWAFPVIDSTPRDWLLIAYLGVFQIGVAYALVTTAMHRISALEVSLIIMIEPVLNPFWAWLFLGEMPALLAVIAGFIIVASITARTLQQRRLR